MRYSLNRKVLKRKMNRFILITLCVFAFLFFIFQMHHYIDLRSFYLTKVQKITQSISNSFYFYYHNVQNIALNSAVQGENKKKTSDYFDSIIALYPEYEYIVMTDKGGKVLAMNSIGRNGKKIPWKTFINKSLVDYAWYERINSESKDEDYRKKIFGSSVIDWNESQFSKEFLKLDIVVMEFSSSIINDKGEVTGYINTVVNREWVYNKLDIVKGSQIDKLESEVVVINKENEILARNQFKEEKIKPLPFELKTSNMTKNLLSGDIINVIKSIETFFSLPFFIASEFQHTKFLDQLGWKAIVKIDKVSFFKDFILKMGVFFIVFFVWAMFLKSLESTLLRLNAFNEVDRNDNDEKLFQLKLLEKTYEKLQEKVISSIDQIYAQGKDLDLNHSPVRNFKMENPYENLISLKGDLEENNDSFLKLQVFFENEEYYLNEMSKYINRNIEDILDIKSQVDEIKRVMLNIQIKSNVPERKTKEVELKLNRLIMSSNDIKKGLESIKDKNQDSKMKRALAWGEFKDKHINFIHKNKRIFDMSEERFDIFHNEITVFNQKLKAYSEETSKKLNSIREREELLVSELNEIERYVRKNIVSVKVEDAA